MISETSKNSLHSFLPSRENPRALRAVLKRWSEAASLPFDLTVDIIVGACSHKKSISRNRSSTQHQQATL